MALAEYINDAAVLLNRSTPSLMNLAIILETLGRFGESQSIAREAHMLDPTDELAGGLYADALIRDSQWREGWPLYIRYHHGLERLRQFIAEWPGPAVSLAGKRLLVIEGGGFGDNILFLRWLPRLAALGAHVTYVAPSTLVPLVAANADALGIRAVIPNLRGDAAIRPADYDYFVPLLALAHRFNLTVADLYWTGPYLTVPPAKASIRDVYGEALTPTVGLCWKAGEGAYPMRFRSLAEPQIRRLLAATNVRWVSLQYDERPPDGLSPRIDQPAIADWLDTAAILANLDLVVTVDTGVAHLGGAMGIPTWVMLPGRCSWPFLLSRDDSPLYPSVRLFRNGRVGIDHAVTAAAAALEAV